MTGAELHELKVRILRQELQKEAFGKVFEAKRALEIAVRDDGNAFESQVLMSRQFIADAETLWRERDRIVITAV